MGIVIRQSFWSSIFIYSGVVFGYLATLLLFPAYFSVDQIGLIRLIQSNAMMLLPLGVIGMNGSFLKYYPDFKNDIDLRNQILTYQLILIILVCTIVAGLVSIFRESVSLLFVEKSSDYIDYIHVSIIILVSQSIFELFVAYSSSLFNIVLPTFLRETLMRMINIMGALAFGFGLFDFDGFIFLTIINYVLATIIIVLYTYFKYGVQLALSLDKMKDGWFQKINSFGIYTLILAGGSSIITNVGFLFTSLYLGLEDNGILTTSIFIGIVIELPKRATNQIITPIITNFFSERKKEELKSLYTRASLNLSVVGSLIAIGIVTNVQDLFLIIPKGEVFQKGYWVVMLVAASKLTNMIFGIGAEILMYSQYKKLMVRILILTSILVIISNIFLIPKFGILGAGIAFFLPNFLSQLLRAIWIQTKLKMQLLTKQHLKLLGIFILVLTFAYFFNVNTNPIVRILVRSVSTTILFVMMIYYARISYEINGAIKKLLSKFKLA